MQGYGWTAYDTRTGGSQTVRDAELHIDLTTEFVKSDDGNSWAVRVSGEPRSDGSENVTTTVVLHAAIESSASDDARALSCGGQDRRHRRGQNFVAECRGQVAGLGSFEFSVTRDEENRPVHDTAVSSLDVDEDRIWQAKGMILHQIEPQHVGEG